MGKFELGSFDLGWKPMAGSYKHGSGQSGSVQCWELFDQLRNSQHGISCTLYTFRAIYDGDEHQKFMERLDARIKSHDRDIERMCNFHYQGFIDSIRELLQVRSQAKKLNVSISVKCTVLISECRLCILTSVCLTISLMTVTCCAVNFTVCLCLPAHYVFQEET